MAECIWLSRINTGVCVCVRECVRACMHARMRAHAHACVCGELKGRERGSGVQEENNNSYQGMCVVQPSR